MVAYARKDLPAGDEFTHTLNDWYKLVGEYIGIKISRWSIYSVRDFLEVPFPTSTRLTYDGGTGKPSTFVFEQPPTWADIWEACEQAIRESGDHHHVFIERIDLVDNTMVLITGS